MSKKTTVQVQMLCSKCRQKVMKLIAELEGITSIELHPAKNTVTVIGEADPMRIIQKVRKFRKYALLESVGPPKEEKKEDPPKKEKKEDPPKKDAVPAPPQTCRRCEVWYVVRDDEFYSYCSIL